MKNDKNKDTKETTEEFKDRVIDTALKLVIASNVVDKLQLDVDPWKLYETWNQTTDEVIDRYVKFIFGENQEANNETKHENPENSGT